MSNIDILIPGALERRYTESVKPALEAAGVTASKSLLQALGKPECASIWSLLIRRPKKGSILLASDQRGNRKVGDAIVIFSNGTSPQENRLFKIESAFGIFALAQPVRHDEESVIDWEEQTLLAISTDFITIIADILPGNDAFVGVAVWMNSLLPLYIFGQKPLGSESTLSIRDYRSMQEPDVILRAPCKRCAEKGKITCERCDGAGNWQPDGKCNKCEGSTTVECSRCDGRGGGFVGKHGETISHCNRCSGTGKVDCFVCKGSGEPPILTCNSCNGTGVLTCRPCSGSGVIQVEFDPFNGEFSFYDQKIPTKYIQAYDVKTDLEYSLKQAAKATLAQLTAESNLRSSKKKAIEATQSEIGKIDQCLEFALESQGISSDVRNLRPIELGKGESTTKRINKGTVRRFPVLKGSRKQIVEWELESNIGQSVRFEIDDKITEFKQEDVGNSNRRIKPSFQGLEVKDNTTYFCIAFPEGIDSAAIPDQFSVRPDIIPPPELAQQRELRRWCDNHTVPKLIEAISSVESTSKTSKPLEIKALDPNIRNNPRQQEALNLIMSEAPLVLVKGPPGTGKTSLIKEVVFQSILRGEKVLVCSETHTAVANVLERLQRDKRIRMIRHARADNPRLSNDEKKYLEESRQGYLQEQIHACSKKRISELRKLKAQLSKLPVLLDAAYQAAKELQEILQQLSRDEIKAERDQLAKAGKINKSEEEGITIIQVKRDEELAPLIAQLEKLEKTLEKTNLAIEEQNRLKKEASDAFIQKTGRKPDRVKVAKPKEGLLEWLDSKRKKYTPLMFASEQILTERYNAALESLKKNKAKAEEVESEIFENQEKQKIIKKTAAGKITSVKTAAKLKHQKIEEEYCVIIESIKKSCATAEHRLLPPQSNCSDHWNKVTCLPPSRVKDLPDEWLKRISECVNIISEVDGKIEFIHRWILAVESDPGEITRLYWDTLNVFMSTCVGLASWKSFNKRFDKEGVDLVIIDEAAHATLTQSLIPLGRAKRAVLIGDEMQLPPAAPIEMESQCEESCAGRCPELTITGDIINPFKPLMSSCWLERSAFEWILETRPSVPVVMLNRQFRMHPDIADFVASIFYEKGLANGVTAEERTLRFGDFNSAVCLISTSAYRDERFEAKVGSSFKNSLEIEMTRSILQQARVNLSEPTTFGVITPYAAQRELMQSELGDFFGSEGHLKMGIKDIGSVDSFQGSEWDVMIASFVRSPREEPKKCRACLGSGRSHLAECTQCHGRGWIVRARLDWVHDLRRLNVAFSRSRKMLILIGDVEALTDARYGTPAGAEILTRFNDHVLDRGRVLRVWEPR